MAVLLVPSQYGTISAAITAASASDTIVVSAGTYSEHINFGGKDAIFLTGAQNEEVIVNCVLSGGRAVNLDNCLRTVIRGIKFVLTGSTMGSILGAATGWATLRVIECTFDLSGNTGTDGTKYAIDFQSGTTHATAAEYSAAIRCTFIGASGNSSGGAVFMERSGGALFALVEGCLFRNYKASAALVRLRANSSGTSTLVARHNTAVACYLEKAAIDLDAGAMTGTSLIYNNIVDETTITTPASATETFNIILGGAGTGRIRNCTYYHGSAGTSLTDTQAFTFGYYDATCTTGTDPAVNTSTGRILPTSPAYRAGTATTSTEIRAYIGRDRHAFATTPSRGCFEVYPTGTQVLHVKHAYADPIIGFALSGVTLGSPYRNRFDSPFDLAEYIERAITVGTRGLVGLYEFWYDLGLQAYRMGMYSGSFSLITSSTAGYIMGPVSTGTVSVATLDQDRQTLQLSYALDEDPVGEEDQAFVYLSDSGHVYGETNPSGSYRRTFKFNVLSTNENLVYDHFTGAADPLWRLVLNKYFAGAEMRVYRAWGYDMDPFDPETNSDGYTDMVVLDIGPANYNWNDNTMRRFDVTLEGVQA